jgi:hypothetical protein
MHDWKYLHEVIERLWREYSIAHVNTEVGLQVLQGAIAEHRSQIHVLKEARSFGLETLVRRDWPQLELIRGAQPILSRTGRRREAPAQSVYQTAIQVRLQRLEEYRDIKGDQKYFYRGQRHVDWSTTPKILRDLRELDDRSSQLESRLERARAIVVTLVSQGLAPDELTALAILQHYSNELKCSTWLLDVSESPWVALFFASDGGRDRDIGTLEYISRSEWQHFSGRGTSRLGSLRQVSPDGILRIQNQRAFFIEAPHSDLYADLSAYTFYFRQQAGVVFESTAFTPPLARDFIYPGDDPILSRLKTLNTPNSAPKLSWEPGVDAFVASTGSHYLPIAQGLFESEVDRLPHLFDGKEEYHWPEILESACQLHAAVRHCERLPRYIRTLHHLKRVVSTLVAHDQDGSSGLSCDVMANEYLNQVAHEPEEWRAFRDCVNGLSDSCWPMVYEETLERFPPFTRLELP